MFELIDVDDDGVVTPIEMATYTNAEVPAYAFSDFDADADRRITREEYIVVIERDYQAAANAERMFGDLDRDGDGVLTEEEWRGASRTAGM